ncbi:hypothetical protein B0T11DRAFT_277549 [Plectosphaerella cucumerina]|uniref:F-box domain-containing protein n=1 Tax=Plectosphaerella cucumerina TaxID=40658 RepID=A0A8K0TNI0_9PEZI|nr:hypothetical protein B0T11DRAFT_277549 [Plectosphaerella cucumerina]
MERLDTDDILRLRHTSRIFMRLFSQSREFRHLHLTTHEDKNRRQQLARVWAVPRKSIYISKDGRGRLPPLCDTCESIKKDKNRKNDVPFLYCSGCRAEHQAFYFSLQQRRGSNDDERICLGREHSFSLCQHISVTWDALNRLADRSDGNTIICNNTQHTDASGCSHVRRDGPESACCHDDKPQLKAWRDNVDILLEISAPSHVPFRPTSSKNGRVSSLSFRKHVLWTLLRYLGHTKGSGVFWSSMCHVEQGEQRKWDFLKPFDPNICSCLDWGAPASLGPPEMEWRLSPNPTRPWRERVGSDFYTGADEFRRKSDDRCAGFEHRLEWNSARHKAVWHLDWHKCGAGDDFLVLKQTVVMRMRSPTDFGWLSAIRVPRTTEVDEEMRGIAWCSDKDCSRVQRLRALAQPDLWPKFDESEDQRYHMGQ